MSEGPERLDGRGAAIRCWRFLSESLARPLRPRQVAFRTQAPRALPARARPEARDSRTAERDAMTVPGSSYMEQESPETLRDGLAEYYAAHPELFLPDQMPADEAELFRQHDAAHVLFACGITIRGEILIDTWAIFGSTLGVRGYLDYLKLPQVSLVLLQAGSFRLAVELLRSLPNVVRILRRCARFTEKWHWRNYEQHLDRPLREIRAQFNIRVL
jgi:hypothetical protein